ncbi:MAG: deoxyribodipyrimidine photolyase [Proteobacteria bacterium]|nr:MAG: deoxyribodipyrimidine photolyase [Pseudomonadota bacterium]
MTTAIVWFRQDLRVSDNPALLAASLAYDHLIPIYIDDTNRTTQLGAASRVWLHHSLTALGSHLHKNGSQLLLFQGDPKAILQQLTHDLPIDAVFWNRCYDPESIDRDRQIKAYLKQSGIHTNSFNASLLYEPWQVLKKDNTPYRVFTAYWKAVSHLGMNLVPATPPESLPPLPDISKINDSPLNALSLLPKESWSSEMLRHWQIGETAAQRKLTAYLNQSGPEYYQKTRDFPSASGTSRLSPYLHFGEISPREIIWQTQQEKPLAEMDNGTLTFIKELIWREFAYYILYHYPETQHQAMSPLFWKFPWREDIQEPLERWKKGQTGFPIIDAGMRELWATGWMHNRVRMIVASFLTKNLLIDWRVGERWFRDTLVDADLASNTMGWQWASGCGVDAAPYFRIFNPLLQSEKFDKNGDYIRRWVPELASLDNAFIHKPWAAPKPIREALSYPEPLVDLSASRQRALDAYAQIKQSSRSK